MATPRELYNQVLKGEIDAFAARMKQVIDDKEYELQAHERMSDGLARELDRIRNEKPTANSDRQVPRQ